MIIWTSETSLLEQYRPGKVLLIDQNATQYFQLWTERHAKPGRFDVIPYGELNELSSTLSQQFRDYANGSHHFLVYAGTPSNHLKHELEKYFSMTPGLSGYSKHIIVVPKNICLCEKLYEMKDFEARILPAFTNGSWLLVCTTHDINVYLIDFVVILVEGKIAQSCDDLRFPNLPRLLNDEDCNAQRAQGQMDLNMTPNCDPFEETIGILEQQECESPVVESELKTIGQCVSNNIEMIHASSMEDHTNINILNQSQNSQQGNMHQEYTDKEENEGTEDVDSLHTSPNIINDLDEGLAVSDTSDSDAYSFLTYPDDSKGYLSDYQNTFEYTTSKDQMKTSRQSFCNSFEMVYDDVSMEEHTHKHQIQQGQQGNLDKDKEKNEETEDVESLHSLKFPSLHTSQTIINDHHEGFSMSNSYHSENYSFLTYPDDSKGYLSDYLDNFKDTISKFHSTCLSDKSDGNDEADSWDGSLGFTPRNDVDEVESGHTSIEYQEPYFSGIAVSTTYNQKTVALDTTYTSTSKEDELYPLVTSDESSHSDQEWDDFRCQPEVDSSNVANSFEESSRDSDIILLEGLNDYILMPTGLNEKCDVQRMIKDRELMESSLKDDRKSRSMIEKTNNNLENSSSLNDDEFVLYWWENDWDEYFEKN